MSRQTDRDHCTFFRPGTEEIRIYISIYFLKSELALYFTDIKAAKKFSIYFSHAWTSLRVFPQTPPLRSKYLYPRWSNESKNPLIWLLWFIFSSSIWSENVNFQTPPLIRFSTSSYGSFLQFITFTRRVYYWWIIFYAFLTFFFFTFFNFYF
jgi:hypothetical protein